MSPNKTKLPSPLNNGWIQKIPSLANRFSKVKKIIGLSLAFLFGLLLALIIFQFTTIKIPIFGFHNIVDQNNPQEVFLRDPLIEEEYTKQDLAEFIEYLVQNNYWFLSAQELYDYFLSDNKKPIPADHKDRKPIMLTFDDGYKSAHKNILAILEDIENRYQKKIKVVWFINPGFMGIEGSEVPHASCEELRTGLEKGYYDLQSHGQNHTNLTELAPKMIESELSRSQRELRKCAQGLDPNNRVASHFAYPFSAVNSTVEKYVDKYYLSGYLYNSRILRPACLRDRYHIPRLTINHKSSFAKLKIMASGFWI